MRVSEIERLRVLRTKKDTGAVLTARENETLTKLEDLERKEIEKNGINGSRKNSSGSGNQPDQGGSNEQGERNQPSTSDPGNTDKVGSPRIEPISDNRETAGNSGNLDDPNGSNRGENNGCEEFGGSESGIDGGTENRGEEGTGEEEGQRNSKPIILNTAAPIQSVKAVRKKAAPKEKVPVNNPIVNSELDFIAIILQTGFSTIATVTARDHWAITQDEATSVSTPLAKMFDQLDKVQKKKLEKYINPVMLASAVAGIVIPRLMVDLANSKQGVKYIGTKTEVKVDTNRIITTDDNRTTEAGEQKFNADTNQTDPSDVNSIIAGIFK